MQSIDILNSKSDGGLVNMKIYSILVVDDDETVIQFIRHSFKEINFVIKSANNGYQAINLLKSRKFDLMFLDINMPYMNGETLLQRLKSSINKDKIILLTADNRKEMIQRIVSMGIRRFLLKPTTMTDIRKITFEMLKIEAETLIKREFVPARLNFEKSSDLNDLLIHVTGIPDENFPIKAKEIFETQFYGYKYSKIHFNVNPEFKLSLNAIEILEKLVQNTINISHTPLYDIRLSGGFMRTINTDRIKNNKVLSKCKY
ncbi:MAG: hypothetical protein CK427_10395 [Leptospira sp.]|nr:MAG: hypothetical protein CK427_10395 [Leptospira sp.]